ncbi:MAG TPA: hypothetical protein ENI77_00580, partial [Nitrospirae bacterium]|nr:hypothetical protein [Nitrospirota bacterium]
MFIRIITVVFCVVILSSPTFSEGAWDFLNGKKSKEKEQAEPEDIKQSKNEPITGYTIKIPSCDNLEDFPLNYIDALIADGTISAEIEKYFSQKLSNWNEADYEMFQKIFNDCNTKVYKFFDDYIDETFHEDVADASRKLMAGRTVRKVKKTKNKVESEDSRRAGLSQPAKKRDKSKTVKANKSSVRKGKVKAIKKSSAEQNKKSISSKSGHEETIQRIDISNSRLGSFLSGGKKKNCEAAFKWLGQVEKEYQNIDNELPSGSSLRKVFP